MPTDRRSSPEFDRYASSYAELLEDPMRNRFAGDPLHFHRRKWAIIQKLLKRAGVDAALKKWVDVGCGRGELLEMAGREFAQAAGCDPSAEMIRSSGSFPVEHQSSSTRLPFGDASVDFVTAVCVFHHVHGTERTLLAKEIRRVLAPGGLCCIVEHNPWNPVTRAIVRRCLVDVDAELLTAGDAATVLRTAGLRTISTDYFLYLPEKVFNQVPWAEGILRSLPLGGQYALLSTAPA
ncbi:MAG: class I SAM-dependent methyltransferase [Acidobacteriaceae bacterium]